jgi:hypothetical protein
MRWVWVALLLFAAGCTSSLYPPCRDYTQTINATPFGQVTQFTCHSTTPVSITKEAMRAPIL